MGARTRLGLALHHQLDAHARWEQQAGHELPTVRVPRLEREWREQAERTEPVPILGYTVRRFGPTWTGTVKLPPGVGHDKAAHEWRRAQEVR